METDSNTKLGINTLKPGKLPLEFAIGYLNLQDTGPGQPFQFNVTLINPKPVVVVLDVTMPQVNGFEACRLIQQKRKHSSLEVLFVTQHDSPQMMREALDAGARGHVVKSNAGRDLLEAVEAVSQHRTFTALTTSPLAVPGGNSSQSKLISGAVTGRKDLP